MTPDTLFPPEDSRTDGVNPWARMMVGPTGQARGLALEDWPQDDAADVHDGDAGFGLRFDRESVLACR